MVNDSLEQFLFLVERSGTMFLLFDVCITKLRDKGYVFGVKACF